MTPRQVKLVKGIIAGKTVKVAAIEAGYPGQPETARVSAHHDLQKAHIASALEAALDKMGATIEKSAAVIARNHDAKDVRFFPSVIKTREPLLDQDGNPLLDGKGKALEKLTEEQVIMSREVDDGAVQLKAAELALRARKLIGTAGESDNAGTVNLVALISVIKNVSSDRGLPL